jgi:hypothetical protein
MVGLFVCTLNGLVSGWPVDFWWFDEIPMS